MIPNKWKIRLDEYSNKVEDNTLPKEDLEDISWLRDNLLGTGDKLVPRANHILERYYDHMLHELPKTFPENGLKYNRVLYMKKNITEERHMPILRKEAEEFSERMKKIGDDLYRALTGLEPSDDY